MRKLLLCVCFTFLFFVTGCEREVEDIPELERQLVKLDIVDGEMSTFEIDQVSSFLSRFVVVEDSIFYYDLEGVYKGDFLFSVGPTYNGFDKDSLSLQRALSNYFLFDGINDDLNQYFTYEGDRYLFYKVGADSYVYRIETNNTVYKFLIDLDEETLTYDGYFFVDYNEEERRLINNEYSDFSFLKKGNSYMSYQEIDNEYSNQDFKCGIYDYDLNIGYYISINSSKYIIISYQHGDEFYSIVYAPSSDFEGSLSDLVLLIKKDQEHILGSGIDDVDQVFEDIEKYFSFGQVFVFKVDDDNL